MSEKSDRTRAEIQQAESLLEAGVSLSLDGEDNDALVLFNAAKDRFTKLHMTLNAGIAGAWINSLKKHQAQPG